jgi:hypothetical protein
MDLCSLTIRFEAKKNFKRNGRTLPPSHHPSPKKPTIRSLHAAFLSLYQNKQNARTVCLEWIKMPSKKITNYRGEGGGLIISIHDILLVAGIWIPYLLSNSRQE